MSQTIKRSTAIVKLFISIRHTYGTIFNAVWGMLFLCLFFMQDRSEGWGGGVISIFVIFILCALSAIYNVVMFFVTKKKMNDALFGGRPCISKNDPDIIVR